MKKYITLIAAAAIVVSAAGCTSLDTVDIDSEKQAYSRVLYDGSDFYTDEDDEEWLDEYFNEEEPVEHQAENDEKKDEESSKKESKKTASSKSDKKSSSKSSSTASKAASSKSTSRSYLSNSSTSSSASSTASEMTVSSKKPVRIDRYVPNGQFEEIDLSYKVGKERLDFYDSERYVRDLLGQPINVFLSEDDSYEILDFGECTITFSVRESDGIYNLTNIVVPYESLYYTFKGVETQSFTAQVINAYGEPDEIIYAEPAEEPQEDTQPQPEEEQPPEETESTQPETDAAEGKQSAENDTDEDVSLPPDDTDITDTTDADSDSGDIETPAPGQSYSMIYRYSIGDKALLLYFDNDEVVKMEYRWDKYPPAEQ